MKLHVTVLFYGRVTFPRMARSVYVLLFDFVPQGVTSRSVHPRS